MIKLKEIVPYSKSGEIEKGLSTKHQSFSEDTFGVDMEFHTSDPNAEEDPYDYVDEWAREAMNDHDILSDYRDWLQLQRDSINGRRFSGRWDDRYGPIDVDDWLSDNPEPEKEDYEDDEEFQKAFDEWSDKKDEVESDFSRWEDYDSLDYLSEWVKHLVNTGEWNQHFSLPEPEHYYNDDVESRIIEYIEETTEKILPKSGWDVGRDAGDMVEVRTPPMKYTSENLDLLKEVMDYCTEVASTGGDTSFHIHVGLPNDIEVFDLFAMSTLVDEKAVQQDLSDDRELERWSELSPALHSKIIERIGFYLKDRGKDLLEVVGKSFVVENKVLESLILNISRYHGVNIQSFRKNHTIEFRYFSSQISPYPEKMAKWIKYFMLVAKIGQSRNQFLIGKNEKFPLVFTREEKNKVKITVLDENGKLPRKPDVPTSDLKKDKGNKDALRQVLQQKMKDRGQLRFPFDKQFSRLKLP